MVEAARTSASTFEVWVIVVVAVGLVAFWLSAIFLADRSQVRTSGQAWRTAEREASDSEWTGRTLRSALTAQVGGQTMRGRRSRLAGEELAPEGDIPARADLPAQPTGEPAVPALSGQSGGQAAVPAQRTGTTRPGEPAQPVEPAQAGAQDAVPAQRTGEADRAERSYAGPPPSGEDEHERRFPSRLRWLVTRGHR